jgi:hypothetical protein
MKNVAIASGLVGESRERFMIAPSDTSMDQDKASAGGDKKLVQSVGLQLLVKNAAQAATDIERVAGSLAGEIEKSDLKNDGSSRRGEILLRIPAARLEEAVAQLSKLAIRVENQHRESRDITREFADNDARLRNMKLEEGQYLALLHRAGNMKDTLEVTEKISEVRGEIEQLQGEVNWQSHQVAMSAVQLQLIEEPQAAIAARWRPIYNAKNSVSGMLLGLGEWFDWMVGLVIDIPLIAVWCLSVGGLAVLAWKFIRWVWIRFLKPSAAAPVTV